MVLPHFRTAADVRLYRFDSNLESWLTYDDSSKRAFQTQIKKWNFPSKHHPATKNEALVQRVLELWRKNTSQKEMLLILQSEGFDIKDRELTRVRHNNQWRLRIANNAKPQAAKNNDEIAIAPELEQAGGTYTANSPGEEQSVLVTTENGARKRSASIELAPEVQAKRQARLAKLEAESAQRYQQRTRRRRTKEWAGLPADPPGPPRFPSETTIEESKVLLRLDDDTYRRLRDQFQRICEDHNVVKKTQAGPEQWQAIKDQLVRENPHLPSVFYVGDGANLVQQNLALDVICSDVTKRIRTLKTRVTIAEAKNEMGVDPEEARQLRAAFYNILVADHFTSKLEAGEDHWKELKEKWIAESPLLQRILGHGDASPDHTAKVKAAEVLCRDVMKRLRDDQTKKDPSRRKRLKTTTNIGPSIQNGMSNGVDNSMDDVMNNNHGITNGIATLASQALASAHSAASPPLQHQDYDGQIDPTLLFAASAPPIEMTHHPDQTHRTYDLSNGHDLSHHAHELTHQLSHHAQFPLQPPHSLSHPTPIYFRLSPLSPLHAPPTLWLDTLPAPPTIRALHALAGSKHAAAHPGVEVRVVKIEGVVKVGGVEGGEVKWTIEEEDELVGYLAHLGGEKATFVVGLGVGGG